MSQVELTVAVATCGRPADLERCLAALAAQDAAPADVIVVDQEPTERAREVVASSGLEIRYLEQPRLGLSASRNLALRETRTEALAVTDDDCAPDPGWVAAIKAAFSRPPRPQAVTGPVLPLGDAPAGGHAISLRETGETIDHRGRKDIWGVGSGGNFGCLVEHLQRLGGWDERLGAGSPGMAAEDADLLYRLLMDGACVRYDPEVVVRHAWQTRERRMATRWSYGYGVGAMGGMWLRRGDLFALRIIGSYARLHLRPLLAALVRRDRSRAREHCLALASLVPGLVYGARVAGEPPASLEAPGP